MITLPVSTGAKLPSVGFGFWKVEKASAAEVAQQAIAAGYRHLDCACDYGNEMEVGHGIAQAMEAGLCRRDDLWVTSKLWNTYHAAEHVSIACEKSLQDLGLKQLDLYLMHFPIAQRYVSLDVRYPPGWFFDPAAAKPCMEEVRVPLSETWAAMEKLVDDGLVKHIGICNFGTSLLRDLLSYARIRPSVLQVESHPCLVQAKLLRYCQQEGIAFTAFSPLGAASYYSLGMANASESLLDHRIVQCIALEKHRSAAQVLLRWGVQRGTSVIPKTSDVTRMKENLQLFDFELSDDEMQSISELDRQRRFNDPGVFWADFGIQHVRPQKLCPSLLSRLSKNGLTARATLRSGAHASESARRTCSRFDQVLLGWRHATLKYRSVRMQSRTSYPSRMSRRSGLERRKRPMEQAE